MKNIKYRMLALIIFLIGLSINLYGQELNIYQLDEKSITVNEFNILDEINEEDIDFEIGTPDSIIKGGQQELAEFGYETIEYCYGNSYISVRNYLISDIKITDTSLSINNIKVGDDILKVKSEFLKNNVQTDRILINYGDFALSFYYNSYNKITKIIYYVPL
ncbi:MAG: hypothetical protein ABFR32_11975 [Bacteroidota bacterium]